MRAVISSARPSVGGASGGGAAVARGSAWSVRSSPRSAARSAARRVDHGRGRGVEHRAEAVPGTSGEEADRGDRGKDEVALLAAGGAEVEARGAVGDDPGLELPVDDRVATRGGRRCGRSGSSRSGGRRRRGGTRGLHRARVPEPGIRPSKSPWRRPSSRRVTASSSWRRTVPPARPAGRRAAPRSPCRAHAVLPSPSSTGRSWLGATRGATMVASTRFTSWSGTMPSARASNEGTTRWRRTSGATSKTSWGSR